MTASSLYRPGETDPPYRATYFWHDDFGHILRQPLPDHGTKTARYDEANRIVQIGNADGSRIDYSYDIAGRLTRKTTTTAGGKTDTVTLAYDGHVLVERRDSAQSSLYAYDALGRKTAETITFIGLKAAFATATRFDPATGLVEARTLADGRVMRIERSDAQHGATAQALRLQPAWAAAVQDWTREYISTGVGETIGRWLPSQPIARDIQVDPFDGLTASTAGNGLTTRRKFDIAGRLAKLDIQKIGELTYRYGNGPRIRGIDSPLMKADYRYSGFGRLQSATPGDTPRAPPKRDALGRTIEDAHFRYTYTAASEVETVSDKSGQPIATYRYNSLGQRVAKTVNGVTTYTLWQAGNRVAEIDGDGKIQTQYLYLAEGQRATPIAKLDAEHVNFIHTDHRGAPIAMTDEEQAIVWRANLTPWGTAEPLQGGVSQRLTFGTASLNLRLPGQYYDEETGLHDNWHRTYDPGTGRYLQPDPLGYPDGANAYAYVNGDPINKIDPMGLYDTDVHYYLTYFLAILSGIDEKQARVIATANQTMDNVNPYTDAFPSLSASGNYDARYLYHFTQDGFDPKPGAGDIIYTDQFDPISGQTVRMADYSPEYQLRRLTAWNNTQIQTLHGYAISAGDTYGPCMKGQFYGEYLHALQDVFGHRKANNDPYGALLGHPFDGQDPDRTYNLDGWKNNEDRTLEMEKVVFERLQSDFGREAKDKDDFPIQFSDIETFLKDWNHVGELGKDSTEKKRRLDNRLTEIFGKETKIPDYDKLVGLGCRLKYLRDAHLINADGKSTSDAKKDYPGAILDTKTDGAAECNSPA